MLAEEDRRVCCYCHRQRNHGFQYMIGSTFIELSRMRRTIAHDMMSWAIVAHVNNRISTSHDDDHPTQIYEEDNLALFARRRTQESVTEDITIVSLLPAGLITRIGTRLALYEPQERRTIS